jgi:hypothetical protein
MPHHRHFDDEERLRVKDAIQLPHAHIARGTLYRGFTQSLPKRWIES